MGRRSTDNSRSKNVGFVENMSKLDLRQLKKGGLLKDGELCVYEAPQSSCGLVLADLRHGSQYLTRIVLVSIDGVRQTIPLKYRITNFGGYRWYMVDLKDRLHEIGYLWGGYYGSRQDIGIVNYGSQCEPRWSRLQQKKRSVELKIENLRGHGKVAERYRRQLRDAHWQLELACDRTIEEDGAPLLAGILTRRYTQSRRRQLSQERFALFERAMNYKHPLTAQDDIIAQFEPILNRLKTSSANHSSAIATGTSKTGKGSPVAEVDLRLLHRLGCCNPGTLTGREIGWPPGWLQHEGRRVWFLIDRRLDGEDCALFVVQDEGEAPLVQFFWIRSGKGAFDKPQLFFWDPRREDVTDRLRFSHSGFRYHADDLPERDDWDFAVAGQEAKRLQRSPDLQSPHVDIDLTDCPDISKGIVEHALMSSGD